MLLLAAAVAAATFASALNVASRLAQTSDSAQSFLEGHAIVRGNLLLAGWNLPLDNYYLTDSLPYAALEWLVGPSPFLLALVPALTYTVFVCTAFAVSFEPRQLLAHNIAAGAAITLMLAAPPWIGGWNPLLMSDMHFATVLGALAALALCAGVARSRSRNAPAAICAALVAVSAATVASDPFSLVFAFGPALLVVAADAFLRRPKGNERTALLVLAIGTALGLLLPSLIALAGGFTTENIVVTDPVAARVFGRNLIALFAGALTLFGANPSGTALTVRSVLLLSLHGFALAIAIAAVWRVARRLFAEHIALFDRLLCAGILVLLAACALSTQFGKGITPQTLWNGGPPMRYVMPAVLFAAVLGARRIPEMLSALRQPRVLAVARPALGLFAAAAVGGSLSAMNAEPRWIGDNPPMAVARWLARQGLTEGEGEYWSANLVTAMSGDAVRVRSVVPLEGRLVPYVLAADKNGYARPPQFIVWQDGNKTGMTLADVRATFGVCRMALIAGYRIAVLPTTDDPAKDRGCASPDHREGPK